MTVKGWLRATLVMAALFVVPVGLVAYPVLTNQPQLAWMLFLGLVGVSVATGVFTRLCLRGENRS